MIQHFKFTISAMMIAGPMIALVACQEPPRPRLESDPQLRAERFEACMKLLPAGPVQTKYNDWDEVVSECDRVSYRQSLYCFENCPPPRQQKARD